MPWLPRFLILLCAFSLALPSTALAQAGDEQYADPFAQSEPRAQAQGEGEGEGLGEQPPAGGGETTPTTPEAPEQPAPEASGGSSNDGRLPNTGSDPRLLGLAGLGILLVGVGLRLRTADETLF